MDFELYKNEIRLLPDTITHIPEMVALVDSLANEDEQTKIALYIFLAHNTKPENPLNNLPDEERKDEAINLLFDGDKSKLDAYDQTLLKDAITAYKASIYDPMQEEVDVYNKKLFEFMHMLQETELEIIKNVHELTGRVSFTTNLDIITNILNNILTIIIDKAALIEMQKTGKYTQRLRGRLSVKKQQALINKLNNNQDK